MSGNWTILKSMNVVEFMLEGATTNLQECSSYWLFQFVNSSSEVAEIL